MSFFHPFRDNGILGMNRRNACYTLRYNPRKFYPLVDDKLQTKQLLEEHAIPTPILYFEIRYEFELKYLRQIKHLKKFAIKPARGAEGRGILVIADKDEQGWKTSGGERLTMEDIEYHVSNILAGLYSLSGVDDHAFIEYFVQSHPVFRPFTEKGVPDIRVILYRGVPVMSMLRLPTMESRGKANLHQGAVGAGVDMLSGITVGGVHKNMLIEKHPDTGQPIAGITLPHWNYILETAVKTYEIFKLGYFGIDFVIDRYLGPLILELNARPGLSIQLANRHGLLPRLSAVDRQTDIETLAPRDRLALSREIVTAV